MHQLHDIAVGILAGSDCMHFAADIQAYLTAVALVVQPQQLPKLRVLAVGHHDAAGSLHAHRAQHRDVALNDDVVDRGVLVGGVQQVCQPGQVRACNIRRDAAEELVQGGVVSVLPEYIDCNEQHVVVLVGIGTVFVLGAVRARVGAVDLCGQPEIVDHVATKRLFHGRYVLRLFRVDRPVVVADVMVANSPDHGAQAVPGEKPLVPRIVDIRGRINRLAATACGRIEHIQRQVVKPASPNQVAGHQEQFGFIGRHLPDHEVINCQHLRRHAIQSMGDIAVPPGCLRYARRGAREVSDIVVEPVGRTHKIPGWSVSGCLSR